MNKTKRLTKPERIAEATRKLARVARKYRVAAYRLGRAANQHNVKSRAGQYGTELDGDAWRDLPIASRNYLTGLASAMDIASYELKEAAWTLAKTHGDIEKVHAEPRCACTRCLPTAEDLDFLRRATQYEVLVISTDESKGAAIRCRDAGWVTIGGADALASAPIRVTVTDAGRAALDRAAAPEAQTGATSP